MSTASNIYSCYKIVNRRSALIERSKHASTYIMNFECSGNRLPVRGVEACILTADTYLVVALVGWLTLFQSSTIGTYILYAYTYSRLTERDGYR